MGQNMRQAIMHAVVLAVEFAIFPLVLTATALVTGYAHIATFTGLSAIALLIPLTALVAMIFNSAFGAYQSAKGRGSNINLMSAIGAPISLFVGILLLASVILPALYTLYTTDNGTYTGLQAIITIAPLPMLAGIAFGSGYMAYKASRGGGKKHHSRRHY
jgi:hypothetical protein